MKREEITEQWRDGKNKTAIFETTEGYAFELKYIDKKDKEVLKEFTNDLNTFVQTLWFHGVRIKEIVFKNDSLENHHKSNFRVKVINIKKKKR